MKHPISILLLLAVFVLSPSCTKTKESPDPASSSSGNGSGGSGGRGGSGGGGSSTTVHLTCKINGSAYAAQSFEGNIFMGSISLNSFPQGTWTYPNVGLTIPVGTGPGTYTQGDGVLAVYSESANPADIWNLMTAGTVTISSHDETAKEIKGSFSCTVKNLMSGDSKDLTEGSFYMKYN